MKRGYVSYLACAALAVGMLVSPASAVGQGTETLSIAYQGAPDILSGQLTDTAGKGVAANGPLTMYAWPSNKALDALKVGAQVKLVPVGQATTDTEGNFTFHTVAARVVAGRPTGEPVNVTIIGASGAGHHRLATSIAQEAFGGRQASVGADPPPRIVMKPAATGEPVPVAVPQAGLCGSTVVAAYGEVPAQVGGTFVHAAGATSEYQFTAGATTTLGVGTSGEGRYGSFAAGGTSSLTSDFSINFPVNKEGAYFHQAYVVPKKLRNTCYTPDGVAYTSWYEVRATSYAGGGNTVQGTSFATMNHCSKLGKGSTWEKNTTTAITWSSGLQLGRVIGLNLSSRSGFTNASKIVVNTGSEDRMICGHHGMPGYTGSEGPRSIKVVNP